MQISLEKYEIESGVMVGIRRKIESLWKRRKRIKAPEDWSADAEAACAEQAVAKLLDKYYSYSVNTFKSKADVGEYEVRHTTLEDGKLIIRPTDSSQATYILVRGFVPHFEVVGYIKGEDAMKEKYMRNPGSKGVAFFVPADELTPIELLIE